MGAADRPPLWLEQFAGFTGATAVAGRLGHERFGPYLFVTGVWAIDRTLLTLTADVEATLLWATIGFLELAGLFLVASTAILLSVRTAELGRTIEKNSSACDVDEDHLTRVDRVLRRVDTITLSLLWRTDDDVVTQPVSPHLRRFFFACGLSLHLVYLFAFSNLEFVSSTWGILSGGVSFIIIIPFVYYPILAEFVAIVTTVHFGLPAWIRSNRLFDFEDVSGYGGLRPVGSLIETSGHRYVVGLVIYTLITIALGIQTGAIDGETELIYVDLLYVAVGATAGAVLVFYPTYALHRFMRNQKDTRLRDIAERVSQLDGDGSWFPEIDVSDPNATPEYMQYFINMRSVKDIREYPVNLKRLTSFVTGLLVPFIIEYGMLPAFLDLIS